MPLFYVPSMKKVESIPHDAKNRPIINRIPKEDWQKIFDELNNRVDAVVDSPKELITSGWIPGNHWEETVWYPIYVASQMDPDISGMVFGAIVFEVIMNREEDWSLGKYQVNSRDIRSTTYFRIHQN